MRLLLLPLLFLLSVARSSGAETLRISAFSSVLAEIAGRVGGEEVVVTSHVPAGSDPHEFEPKPSDLKRVAKADLVLLSAKHLEGYVGKLKEASGGRVPVLEVGAQLPSLWLESESKDARSEDPHWWHSVENMRKAAKVVSAGLSGARPEKKSVFAANLEAYTAELGDLQKWARGKVAELPRDKRKLVTSHDALQYFAKEYGFTVYPVAGLTASEQPSSRQVADLLKTIKAQRVKAVFAEDTANPKVLQQITAETGAVLGGLLWVDGLGTGTAGTYAGMMRHNVATIVDALK
ncbi:MAG: zinc/manganese transport system substrate-binding protein [Verrucomicrobia bacterium]|nr:MAG: zinc/manganese transport system substrate-binding protein [Verrucomicrobiota bacterium]